MTDIAGWIGILVAACTLALAWMTFRIQRNRKRLEYVVLSNQRLVHPRVADELEVRLRDKPLNDPSLLVLRMVNTGDKAIPAATFESPLTVRLEGAQKIATASVAALRPRDLSIKLSTQGAYAHVEPLLLNPGDLIEIQIIAAGWPTNVSVEGRIADVTIKSRAELPYPPGSGLEGEMVAFDRIIWWGTPIVAFGFLLWILFDNEVSEAARISWVAAGVVALFIIYPMHVNYLVRRRRRWRP